jgi:hypothetical protein
MQAFIGALVSSRLGELTGAQSHVKDEEDAKSELNADPGLVVSVLIELPEKPHDVLHDRPIGEVFVLCQTGEAFFTRQAVGDML